MTKLNILPAPTFERLGVNYTEREIKLPERENITVDEGTQQIIIQYRTTDSDTSVTVGKGAELKFIQIFDSRTKCVSVLKSELADNAKLELIQLYLGGDTISETITELSGIKSEFTADIGYDLGNADTLDLNIVSEHYGRKSTSEINVSGVLRSDAKKTFKGTIDFKRGSSGAQGNEKEDVILMNAEVVNKSVPVILCDEEDVVGNHGATIGRIDGSLVFYMKSRGISEEKIYELATHSKLMRIIRKIGDEQAEKRVYNALGWGDDVE